MKLKHAMILAFLLVATIPFGLGLNFIQDYTASQYRAQFEDHLSSLSQIAKKRILSAIERVEDNTALLKSRTQMRLSLDAWNRTGAPEHREKIGNIIHDARADMDRLLSVSVFDQKGMMVTTTDADELSPELSVKPVGEPEIALVQNGRLMVVSFSRLALENKTVGYLVVEFSADFLLDLVRDRAGLGTTGEWLFAVRNEDGDAVFAVPLKYDHAAAFQRKVAKDREDVPITQALLGNEIIMRAAPDYREEPVLASTRYLPGLDWGLVVKINESEVEAIVDKANRFLVWLVLGVILMAILFGFAVSHYIASPVEQLKANTDRVAHGDFDLQPLKSGWYEVKELSLSFTNMAAAIKDLSSHLNKKVEERTEELNEANKKLHEIAIRDVLTGLYNRRYLMERFGQELDRAKRYGNSLYAVLLDIDHFKQVNDTWGHDAGDLILKNVAALLEETVRDSDILGRYGGEEFCIIIPNVDENGVSVLLERLREKMAAQKHAYGEEKLRITCSFGVAALEKDIADVDSLLKLSDLALYQAKEAGRNRVSFYRNSA